jgi:hypothetical protein
MNKLINVPDIIDERLTEIKNNFSFLDPKLLSRGFAAPRFLKINSILFLGINPSFIESKDKGPGYYDLYVPDQEIYSYFKKFIEVSIDCEIDWAHLDLLYFRETKQEKVDDFVYGKAEGLDFISKQLVLTKELIELTKPQIIIASNTKVRQLLGFDKKVEKNQDVWLGYDFEFDYNIGTYRIKTEGVLYNVPIFFTSMLSGQRALDNGSFKRLKWHIKFALDKK